MNRLEWSGVFALRRTIIIHLRSPLSWMKFELRAKTVALAMGEIYRRMPHRGGLERLWPEAAVFACPSAAPLKKINEKGLDETPSGLASPHSRRPSTLLLFSKTPLQQIKRPSNACCSYLRRRTAHHSNIIKWNRKPRSCLTILPSQIFVAIHKSNLHYNWIKKKDPEPQQRFKALIMQQGPNLNNLQL